MKLVTSCLPGISSILLLQIFGLGWDGKCQGLYRKEDIVYAANFCGGDVMDSKGISYPKWNEKFIYKDNSTYGTRCETDRGRNTLIQSDPDKALYKEYIETRNMSIPIPIPADGVYAIVLKHVELWKKGFARAFRIRINGIDAYERIETASKGFEKYEHVIVIRVGWNRTQVSVEGNLYHDAEMKNGIVELQIDLVDEKKLAHASISAMYVERLKYE